MVSSAVYSNRCVTTLEKHDRKAAWRICLLNGVTTEQPRSLSCNFVYVCMCVLCKPWIWVKYEYACQKERAIEIISGALQPSKLGSCQCRSEILLQTPPTLFSYPDVIITSRCMIFLTRVCNSATCCILHSARNISYGTTQGCGGSLPRHFGSVFLFFPSVACFLFFTSMFWCLWGLSFAVWS